MNEWPPARLHAEYSRQFERYEFVAAEYAKRIESALRASGVPMHLVTARAKDPLELYKKQLRKNYADPWHDCPDLIGARVILPESSLKSEATSIISGIEGIDLFDKEDQTENADPSELRYRGLHLHLRSQDLLNEDDAEIRCEVQVRTIAEHAWAETEHRYIYKKSIDVGPEIERTFNRLLVLVELFDSELSKGAEMVKTLESYRRLEFSRYLETQLNRFMTAPSDLDLTLQAVGEFVDSGLGSVETMRTKVADYLDRNDSEVEKLLSEHGPASRSFDVASDWILSQGECLLFLALLDEDEFALASALAGSDLFHAVEPLALHTGHTGFRE